MLSDDLRPALNIHYSRSHQSDGLFLTSGDRDNVGLANRQSSTRSNDSAPREQIISTSRREEIDLELDREDAGFDSHETERGITTGAVGDRCDSACVHESVLLTDLGA